YSGQAATGLPLTQSNTLTAAQVQQHLSTISALANKNTVLGANAGPFVVKFNNAANTGALRQRNVPVLTMSPSSSGRIVEEADGFQGPGIPFVAGSTPTQAQMQQYLTDMGLSGTSAVTAYGPNGGPFSLIFNGT